LHDLVCMSFGFFFFCTSFCEKSLYWCMSIVHYNRVLYDISIHAYNVF
jgi:hypothetical protein